MVLIKSAVSALALGAAASAATTSSCHLGKRCDASQRARALLKQMTWEEKIGQMGGVRRVLSSGTTINPQYGAIQKMQNGEMGELP